MKEVLVFSLRAYSSVVIFYILYSIYLYIYYISTPDEPEETKNWGYVLMFMLILIHTIRGINNLKSKAKDYTTWQSIMYDMLMLFTTWILVGNVISIGAMMMDFRYAVINHIFILLFISLSLSKITLSRLSFIH